jgi:hypothetical protein
MTDRFAAGPEAIRDEAIEFFDNFIRNDYSNLHDSIIQIVIQAAHGYGDPFKGLDGQRSTGD